MGEDSGMSASMHPSSPSLHGLGVVIPQSLAQRWHLSLLPFSGNLNCSSTTLPFHLADNLPVGVGVRKRGYTVAKGILDRGRNPGFEASHP